MNLSSFFTSLGIGLGAISLEKWLSWVFGILSSFFSVGIGAFVTIRLFLSGDFKFVAEVNRYNGPIGVDFSSHLIRKTYTKKYPKLLPAQNILRPQEAFFSINSEDRIIDVPGELNSSSILPEYDMIKITISNRGRRETKIVDYSIYEKKTRRIKQIFVNPFLRKINNQKINISENSLILKPGDQFTVFYSIYEILSRINDFDQKPKKLIPFFHSNILITRTQKIYQFIYMFLTKKSFPATQPKQKRRKLYFSYKGSNLRKETISLKMKVYTQDINENFPNMEISGYDNYLLSKFHEYLHVYRHVYFQKKEDIPTYFILCMLIGYLDYAIKQGVDITWKEVYINATLQSFVSKKKRSQVASSIVEEVNYSKRSYSESIELKKDLDRLVDQQLEEILFRVIQIRKKWFGR